MPVNGPSGSRRTLLEARFNLALALERMGAVGPARTAWQQYLERDQTSPWAEEARRRLSELVSRVPPCDAEFLNQGSRSDAEIQDYARRCPQSVREFIENRLLPEWADQYVAKFSAFRRDTRARGTYLRRPSIRQRREVACGGGWRPRLSATADDKARLARGHLEFREGQRRYDGDRRHEGVPFFSRASSLLREAGSPYWLSAEQYLARTASNRRDLKDAIERLDVIASRSSRLPGPVSTGRVAARDRPDSGQPARGGHGKLPSSSGCVCAPRRNGERVERAELAG